MRCFSLVSDFFLPLILCVICNFFLPKHIRAGASKRKPEFEQLRHKIFGSKGLILEAQSRSRKFECLKISENYLKRVFMIKFALLELRVFIWHPTWPYMEYVIFSTLLLPSTGVENFFIQNVVEWGIRTQARVRATQTSHICTIKPNIQDLITPPSAKLLKVHIYGIDFDSLVYIVPLNQ